MRTLIRFLFTVAVVGLVDSRRRVVVGGAHGRTGGGSEDAAEVHRARDVTGAVGAGAGRPVLSRGRHAGAERPDHQVFTLEQQGQSQVRQETAERLYVMRPVGKLAIPELQVGRRAADGARRAPGALRLAARRDDGDPRRGRAPGAAADLARVHLPLRQPRRQRVRGLPRHAGRRRLRRSRRRQGVHRLPGQGRGHHRGPGAARGVLRPAVRPGPRTRRSSSSRATRPATKPRPRWTTRSSRSRTRRAASS